jgi:polyhydroxybutyrate depolymerase
VSKLWHGHKAGIALQDGWLDVGGVRRTYLLAAADQPKAPLLIVLHGLGTTGKDMERFSGLAGRGPAAGFATVFPNGWKQMWDGERRILGRQCIDDAGFMVALVQRLASEGVVREGPVFLAGLSNGAFFAEHLARHAVLEVGGLALVAGSATETSRRSLPRPAQSAALVSFAGTADRSVPYGGGPIGGSGLLGRMSARRAGRRTGELGPVAVAAETIANDWAVANGIVSEPLIEPMPAGSEDLPVQRLSWSAPGRPPVTLHRIEGGGHCWPGGPQYLPARFIGPVARHLDATDILLALAQSLVA